MIGEEDKIILSLPGSLYFYLPKFPITWNEDYTAMKAWNLPKLKQLPWWCCVFFMFFGGMAIVVLLIIHFCIQPQAHLHIQNVVMLLIAGVFLLGACYLIFVCSDGTLLHFSNEMLELEKQLLHHCIISSKIRSNFRKKSSSNGIIRSFEQLLLIFCAAGPFTVSAGAIFSDLDVFHFFAEMIMTERYERDVAEIIIAKLVRLLIIFPSIAEGARLVSIILPSGWAVMLSLMNYLNLMEVHLVKPLEYCTWYQRFYLCYGTAQPTIGKCVEVLMTNFYWALVSVIWFTMKYSYDQAGLIYVLIAFSSVIVIIVATLVCRYAVGMLDLCQGIRYEKVRLTMISRPGIKTRSWKYEMASLKSLRDIQVWFGSRFPIGRQTLVSYFQQILDNLINALLVFDP